MPGEATERGDPAADQYIPKVFSLSAGAHQLIIRGREAGTALGTITIAAVRPRLKIRAVAEARSPLSVIVQPPPISITLSVTGQANQVYDVLRSQDLTRLGR